MHLAVLRMLMAVCLLWPASSMIHADTTTSAAPVTAELGVDGIQRATITLDSYSYAPSHLIVHSGIPVELMLIRATVFVPHNFLLKEPDADIVIEEDVGHSEPTRVKFTPTKPGLYRYYCDRKFPFRPSHKEQGMEGKLEVK
ncbi:MAG: quinol oxidase [Nitrospira sp.]|nr:quinol oxidase [Nitrospira sp.]